MSTRVTVTGATGFVAGHVIAELLEHDYAVRATIRDLTGAGKRAHLVELARRTGGELEFAQADLNGDAGWAAAVAGSVGVLHVASPFPATPPDDERELVDTAVEGTLRVLRACAAAGTVRRVVLTSSIAAIAYGHTDDALRTEADWTVVERSPAYQKSKTLAERAAWDFVAQLPAAERFELVVVNPGMVLGPLLSAATSTSHEPVRRLLAGDVPGTPRVGWAPVDVRDLAAAHRLALETPAAAGNRYICAGEHLWMEDMARILAEEYGPRGLRVPTRRLPNWVVRCVALFDKGVRLTLPSLGRPESLSADKAVRELGWTMRPVRESVVDTAESLLQRGIVAAPRRRSAAPAAAPRAARV
ncbi:SDR family oxidoreductase [Nocardia gamkensis]|uniref:Aldehyde reductase n=1 Tax=Nocardia gamkensis TaxID=352869 RepID=A0A7X6L6Z2_9NOCA|nr:aldehyde reductase [Nocardia gamkensis]NKY28819.1 aldehyde reductase [Nocardia gamkensis]NQE68105.1 Bifunctional dihydroflavonol 4-reductase/flavanone 4-reductase [Nocardia gamkensis]